MKLFLFQQQTDRSGVLVGGIGSESQLSKTPRGRVLGRFASMTASH